RPARHPTGGSIDDRGVGGTTRRPVRTFRTAVAVIYLDSSALVKLVLREPESGALRSWLDSVEENRSTSELAHVEVLRACRRITEESVPRARLVLDALDLIPTTAGLLESAARADPAQLRSLDAIHLAAAAS